MQASAELGARPARPALARFDAPAVAGWALAGAGAGVVAKLADESGIRWAADLGTYPAAWVLLLLAIAWQSRAPARAAVRSAAFFVAMAAAYYLYARAGLGFAGGGHEGAWVLAALTVAPLTAASCAWALRSDYSPASGAVMAAMAGLALAGGAAAQYLLAVRGLLPPELLHPVQAVAELGVAGLAVLAPRRPAARRWAAALVLPAAWLVARVVDLGMGALG